MRHLIALTFIAVPCASAWSADIVFRKGSTSRDGGSIISQSKTNLILKPSVGNQNKDIPANEVQRVEWDGEPPNMKLARSAEDGGNLQFALSKFLEAQADVEAGQTNLKADVEFLIARVNAKLAKTDPGKVDEAIGQLEAFRTGHQNSFRFYDAVLHLGETYLVKSDYAKAEGAFKELENAPWEDYKMASQIAQGRLLIRKNEVAEAQTLFEGVANKPAKTDAEKARQYEARLGLATCLQRSGKNTEAAAQLDQIIKEAPASDTKTMGEAYLRKGDNLLAKGDKEEALLAYLHVDILFSGEKDLHAEALYHLASLWTEVGKPLRAADARTKLNSDYPNSEWNKKLLGG